jgi:hypothetical protein
MIGREGLILTHTKVTLLHGVNIKYEYTVTTTTTTTTNNNNVLKHLQLQVIQIPILVGFDRMTSYTSTKVTIIYIWLHI